MHPRAEEKGRKTTDKRHFCWSHMHMDGLQGVVLVQLSVYAFITETSYIARNSITVHCTWAQICAYTNRRANTHTITKQHLVRQWNNESWPQNLRSFTYQALEISMRRFKSSSCPLINSQRSSWPGFYTRNPSLLYLKKTGSHMASHNLLFSVIFLPVVLKIKNLLIKTS